MITFSCKVDVRTVEPSFFPTRDVCMFCVYCNAFCVHFRQIFDVIYDFSMCVDNARVYVFIDRIHQLVEFV